MLCPLITSQKSSHLPAFRPVERLYLDPPEIALVLCVDEKSQVQALERTRTDVADGIWLRRGRDPHELAGRDTSETGEAQD
jgi:hypothetical protein